MYVTSFQFLYLTVKAPCHFFSIFSDFPTTIDTAHEHIIKLVWEEKKLSI